MLSETRLRKNNFEISKDEFISIKMLVIARNDPVFFGENYLGLKFYPHQKIWLWATTKTQKTRCKEMFLSLGICFTTPANFEQDIDKLYNDVEHHIFCVANQCGKTVMTAVKHIWACFFKIGKKADTEFQELDDYKTLNTSPHSDQANKCFEYFQRICRGEMIWYDPTTKKMKKNYPHPVMLDYITGVNNVEKEIRCKNGSTFWSKPSGHDRGTSRAGEQFGYISLDEGSQAQDLESTISALLSRLIRYGFCFDIVSTPEADKPSHAFYMNITRKGIKLEDNWFSLTGVTLDDNVFIDSGQREKAKKSILSASPEKYNQIIKGKFVSTGEHLFSVFAVRQMFSDPTIKRLEQAQVARKYILSIDWAMSDKGDKTWFIVVDYTDYLSNKLTIVNHQIIKGGDPYIKYAAARDVYQRFGGHQQCKFIMDTTAMGGTLIKQQLSDMRPIEFNYGGKKDEMLMFTNMALNHQRKYEVDNSTGETIEHNPDYGKLRCYPIQELEDQLSNYRTDDRKLEQDGVMALSQAMWYIEKLPKNIELDLDINPMNRYNNIRTKNTFYRNY